MAHSCPAAIRNLSDPERPHASTARPLQGNVDAFRHISSLPTQTTDCTLAGCIAELIVCLRTPLCMGLNGYAQEPGAWCQGTDDIHPESCQPICRLFPEDAFIRGSAHVYELRNMSGIFAARCAGMFIVDPERDERSHKVAADGMGGPSLHADNSRRVRQRDSMGTLEQDRNGPCIAARASSDN